MGDYEDREYRRQRAEATREWNASMVSVRLRECEIPIVIQALKEHRKMIKEVKGERFNAAYALDVIRYLTLIEKVRPLQNLARRREKMPQMPQWVEEDRDGNH